MAYVKKADRVATTTVAPSISAMSNKQLISHARKMKREMTKKFAKDVIMLDNSIRALKGLTRKSSNIRMPQADK